MKISRYLRVSGVKCFAGKMAGVSDSDRCKRDRWVGREDVFPTAK